MPLPAAGAAQVAASRRDETVALVEELQARLDAADRTASALRQHTESTERTVKRLQEAHCVSLEETADAQARKAAQSHAIQSPTSTAAVAHRIVACAV